MSMRLYDLSTNINAIWEMVESEEVDLEVLESTLLSLEEAFETKAEGIAAMMKNLDAEAEAIKQEEQRLSARRRVVESKQKWLKSYLENEMERTGITKVKTPRFTLSLQLNPPAVEILDPSAIPAEYMLYPEPQPNKKAILEAFKNKELVSGVRLVQKRGIRVR